jgi:cellulose synthase/poly-beta-1,6-N-acetylglucosamine synthase-like glycosyltransferase
VDFLLYCALFLFAISLINALTIRTPRTLSEIKEDVTVLVPMRNEASNVQELFESLSAQMGIQSLAFIAINDGSTDETAQQLSIIEARDPRVQVISNPALPAGWLGKVSALQHGYESAKSGIIVTIDADVRLEKDALVRAINQLLELNLDFISPYPRQIADTFAEKLIQPLLHWSWMSTVILRLAEKFPRRSTAVANGQFFIARKEALDAIGGFSSVKNEILDDISLARSLISAGFQGVVTEGSAIASTRMYTSFSEIRQGYGKSLWKAFGGLFGSIFAVAFIASIGVLPLLLALIGDERAFLIFLLITSTHAISAIKARGSILIALLHPLSSALLIYLIAYSWLHRGKIQWKGRFV